MDPKRITDQYHVSPQITPADIPAIAAAGFTTVICNRPDEENPPMLAAAALESAAQAAGLAFEVLPISHQTLTPENAARQADMIAQSSGPVLAYCASGNRCTIIWALGQAGRMPAAEIIETAAQAGYSLEHLRPALQAAEGT